MQLEPRRYLFGPFTLNEQERLLLQGGQLVPLPGKAVQVLLILVRNSGHIVEKDQFMKEVWPDEFVEEGNLAQHVFMLRKALGETHCRKYIETIPRRGYRFLKAVRLLRDESIRTTSTIKPHGLPSVAVVPFVNASAQRALDNIAENVTERIIDTLSQMPQFHVATLTSVIQYRGRKVEARQVGHDLGVYYVLFGSVHPKDAVIEIRVEAVDFYGWQVFRKTHIAKSHQFVGLVEEITRDLLTSLRIRWSPDQQQITKVYTANTAAHQAYLKGRNYSSKYTTADLHEAIRWFGRSIHLDPSHTPAYAAIIDCYLRLATNYLPPADDLANTTAKLVPFEFDEGISKARNLLQVRRDWDWKSAERECKRAADLKANYPAAHQWHGAYMFARRLYAERRYTNTTIKARQVQTPAARVNAEILNNTQSAVPTDDEKVQVFCVVARGQIDAGNYEGASAILQPWWTLGHWPNLDDLAPQSSADLLFTVGLLAGHLVSTRQLPKGQKHAEALLNGSIALFEQNQAKKCSAEGQIELSLCYKREGLFDLALTTLLTALSHLRESDRDLKSLGIIRLASIERESGDFRRAVERLNEAAEMVEPVGPWATGRYHLELASTLRELAVADDRKEYFDQALDHFAEALRAFEATGNHRLSAIAENNLGFLLLTQRRLEASRVHLKRARTLFDGFGDKVRCAQVDETMAQLHLAAEEFELANEAIVRSVKSLEHGGENPILAESLRTQSIVQWKLGRYNEARRIVDRAEQLAEHSGDLEGARRAGQIRNQLIEYFRNKKRKQRRPRTKETACFPIQAM